MQHWCKHLSTNSLLSFFGVEMQSAITEVGILLEYLRRHPDPMSKIHTHEQFSEKRL